MPTPLFQHCELCGGSTLTRQPMTVNTGHGTVEKPAGTDCLCLRSSTPGYSPVGLTVGQVDAIRNDRDGLLVALWNHWQSTEPSLPAELVDRLQASSFDVADARRRLANPEGA